MMMLSRRFVGIALLASVALCFQSRAHGQIVETSAAGAPTSSGGSSFAAAPGGQPEAPDQATQGSDLFWFGHIPITISLLVHGGFDDNFRTTQSSQGSWFTNEGINLAYDSPGTVTHINARAGGDLTYYPDQTGGRQDSINSFFNSSISHNISERFKVDANVYATYRTEPDFSSNVGVDTRQGDFFNTLDSVTATYHWTTRFFTVTSDKIRVVQYENSGGGANQLDRVENTADEEFKYDLLHRGNTLVAEYRFEVVDYSQGLRNSTTHFVLAGFDQEFNPELRCTFRGGATFRSYSSGNEETNPQLEGSVSYSGAHHSVLSWRNSYGIEEPSATNVQSRTTFRTGLELKYSFTSRIIGTANVYYHHDDNKGFSSPPHGGSMTSAGGSSNFSEDSVDASIGLRYVTTHRFSVDLGFDYSEISSGDATRDYTRLRYSGGLTYTF